MDDEKGEALFHVINYTSKDGKSEAGFMIISGDRRVTPILAKGDKEKFDLKDLPKGLDIWVNMVVHGIKRGKAELVKPARKIEAMWQMYEGAARYIDPIVGCPDNYYVNSGVLLSTQWGQGFTYNMVCPTRNGCPCNHANAGCGPVAVAQVWNYYQKPVSYNRNGVNINYNYPLPNQRYQFPVGVDVCDENNAPFDLIQMAQLIRQAGLGTQSNYNYPNCNTLTWRENVKDAFQWATYSNSGHRVSFNSNSTSIKSELLSGHPVIIDGTTGPFNFNDWHIWVIDGYEESNYYYLIDPNDPNSGCLSVMQVFHHLNWGWNGAGPNAWYGLSGFIGAGSHYDTNLNVTLGMRP